VDVETELPRDEASQAGPKIVTSLAKASARWLIRFFLPAVHLAEGDVMAVGLEDRVITMALVSAHRPDDAPSAVPGKTSSCPSGQARTSVQQNRAVRGSGAPLSSASWARVIAMTKSRPVGVSAQSAV
jgi:hypothetical protein